MKMIRWIMHRYAMLFLKIPALVLSVFLAYCISGHTQNLLLYEVEGSPSSAGTGKEYFADSLSRELFLKELLASLHGGLILLPLSKAKLTAGIRLRSRWNPERPLLGSV